MTKVILFFIYTIVIRWLYNSYTVGRLLGALSEPGLARWGMYVCDAQFLNDYF